MSNTLSSDLASLKIDREAKPRQGGPLRAILGTVALVGLAVAAYVVGKPYLEAQMFKTTVAVTEISLVSPSQASIELSSSGYVVPQVRSQVGARIPGRVAKLFVKEGDRVEAGQVMIELETRDQQAAITSAKLRVAAGRARTVAAKAGLNEVKQQYDRQKALVAHGAAPQAVADDLASRVDSLEEQVKASEAEVTAAEAEIETL
jgi:multidrug efflux pump subunit AcrA (membrane-fusion protein)